MQQFQVIKQITLILGRMIEQSVSEAVGRPIQIAYEYSDDLKAAGAVTVLYCGVATRAGSRDREYEFADGGERFRNPPLVMRAQYAVSAWAKAPDDQDLLGAVLRTFLDRPFIQPEGMEEEQIIGYAGLPSVDMEPLSFDDHRALAEAFSIPLAPTMRYWVDFRVQSSKTTPIKRVQERVMDFRKIEG